MIFLWFWITYITHVTWELLWLLLHDEIAAARNSAWAYVWWAYIDGGMEACRLRMASWV